MKTNHDGEKIQTSSYKLEGESPAYIHDIFHIAPY